MGPSGADRTQVGPMLVPWTLLSGKPSHSVNNLIRLGLFNYDTSIGTHQGLFWIWSQPVRVGLTWNCPVSLAEPKCASWAYINGSDFDGLSNAMEVECAKCLWPRSVEDHNLCYTSLLGDGDSKAVQALQDLSPYPGVDIFHEECVNHAHKCMGTALINLAKEKKLGSKGHGRLTQGTLPALKDKNTGVSTRGHFLPIRNLVLMRRTPSIHSPKRLRRRSYQSTTGCLTPTCWNTWQKAWLKTQMNACILFCGHEMTLVFVGRHKLQGAAASAIAAYNTGASQLTDLMKRMAVEVNEVTLAYVAERDRQLIYHIERSATKVRKRCRIDLQRECKEKCAAETLVEGASYAPGAFSFCYQ